MAFDALGAVVMISGPRDTSAEVTAVREAIAQWNSDHAIDQRVVFIVKHYATDAVPIYAGDVDGQVVINHQLTEQSDVVICLFKHRLGTATSRNKHSGTIEEADLRRVNHPVHMYFSKGDVPLAVWNESESKKEFDRLLAFQKLFSKDPLGLYKTFDSIESLKESVTRALSHDAKVLQAKGVAATPLSTSARPFSTLKLRIEGTVWRARECVSELVDALVSIDVEEEREWADKNSSQFTSPVAMTLSAIPRRTPKTDEEIRVWANNARRGVDRYDKRAAAAAGKPLEISISTETPLEGVELEVVFRGVEGLTPTGFSYHDLWAPLSKLRRPHQFDRPSLAGVVPPDRQWVQDGDDLVLTIDFGRLRKRRIPDVVNPVILRLLNPEDRCREIEYSWRVTAEGINEEASGVGTLPVMTPEQAEEAIQVWTH
ncbi:hypothetical protein [Rhodococcus sp. ACT016]|uniref:hypothetical protein n=1 Tax=Rhodococcus sp. ACT016 TaxID=3134808 RepID=UPI003D26BDB3